MGTVVEQGIPFFVVTHPETTQSCQDKIDLYTRYNCGRDLSVHDNLSDTHRWELGDTVKSIYFWDKTAKKILVAAIPGKPVGTHIDYVNTFGSTAKTVNERVNPYSNEALNVEATKQQKKEVFMSASQRKKRIRLYPVGEVPLFGVGVEGCLSPLPLEHYITDRERIDTTDQLNAIYIDKALLTGHRGDQDHLVDLSISPPIIPFPEGQCLEQRITEKNARELRQVTNGGSIPLNIRDVDGRWVADVDGPIIQGDYREKGITPQEGEPGVTLRHHVLPNHRLSVLMKASDLGRILETQFPDQTFVIPFEYDAPR